MRVPLDDLPRDVEVLHRLVRDMAGALGGRETALEESRAEVERLRLIVHRFRRARFGPRSERLDPDRLRLGLEDLDADLKGRPSAALPPAELRSRAEAREPEPPDGERGR